MYIFVFCFLVFRVSFAASFTVTPAVIDQKAKARDIIKDSIVLTNNTGQKLNLYTFVNNISSASGEEKFLDPSRADHGSSLANWIAISRGVVELGPGEVRKIDFEIEVNLRANAGMYHARIYFVEDSTRDGAEKKLGDAPSVIVSVEVLEDVKERLQLKKFVPDKTFFSGFPVSFSYELENIGNRPLAHEGEIRIYNRRGEEVTTIGITKEGAYLEPDVEGTFTSVWQGPKAARGLASVGSLNRGFGRYKAFLDLEYGVTQRGTIQDTVFFWIIPWLPIVVIFVTLTFIITLLIYFWRRRVTQQFHSDSRIIDLRYPQA